LSRPVPVENDTKKLIATPPLNLLFNPTFVNKKDIWNINLTTLLESLLEIINRNDSKDLRLCGIAALSSAIIHRIKVESIFELQKIAMQHKSPEYPKQDEIIPELRSIEVPFRFESTYPVSLTDLLHVLENMIAELTNPKQKKKQIDLEANPSFDFSQYLARFEEILKQYQNQILDALKVEGSKYFMELIAGLKPIEIVRTFIAVLYLSMGNLIEIEQKEEEDDIKLILAGR
jgi:segregation and condensation protein A